MVNADQSTAVETYPGAVNEDLRQALLRVTKPGNAALQANMDALRQEILAIADNIHQAEGVFQKRDEDLSQRDRELYNLIQELSVRQAQLKDTLQRLEETSHEQLSAVTNLIESEIHSVKDDLSNPEQNTTRISPLLVPLLHQQARDDNVRFAEAVAPVIGPAIRHQIRDARQDIIDALYPLIGQIIGKAISEAIRELTRSIDAKIHRQSSIGSQLKRFYSRLRGVSEAEMALRNALPYQIHRVFLVHRKSGLLLEHISTRAEGEREDLDIVISMLTAIQDFVHDAFTDRQDELEEIVYGDERILLGAGQNAYLAVALTGVEPQGYHLLIRHSINKINLNYEREICSFKGDVQMLPDFKPELLPILYPEAKPGNLQDIRRPAQTSVL